MLMRSSGSPAVRCIPGLDDCRQGEKEEEEEEEKAPEVWEVLGSGYMFVRRRTRTWTFFLQPPCYWQALRQCSCVSLWRLLEESHFFLRPLLT